MIGDIRRDTRALYQDGMASQLAYFLCMHNSRLYIPDILRSSFQKAHCRVIPIGLDSNRFAQALVGRR